MKLTLLTHENPVGEEIAKALKNGRYSNFKAAVAYVRNSGLSRIHSELADFVGSGGKTSIIAGIDQGNTSYQALVNLKTFAKDNLFIHHDRNFDITFHPKIYLFGNSQVEKVILGSSNFTAGGFYLNYEANISVKLGSSGKAKRFRRQVLDYWSDLLNDKNTKRCAPELLNKLLENGSIADERAQKPFKDIIEKMSIGSPFKARELRTAPPAVELRTEVPALKGKFAMTLSSFDVSERSLDPVLLIPIAALRTRPGFWNFPAFYTYSETGYPQLYAVAEVRVDGKALKDQHIRMYYYEKKREFRLKCEAIKRAGDEGDIIVIRKYPTRPLEFEIELLRRNSIEHEEIRPLLAQRASSRKFFAYL